jgi:hypothetical protein
MAEIKVVGLVDEDDVDLEKRVTLRSEFRWFLTEEFTDLSEDFKPIDYHAFLKEKDNLPTINNPMTSKSDDFWRIYDELEA